MGIHEFVNEPVSLLGRPHEFRADVSGDDLELES